MEEAKTGQPAANGVPSGPPPPEIGQMTRGDYLIHVFIEQGRQMKCPENRTVDPMIECSVLGEKKYSSIKKGITHATTLISWNEHLFFEPRNVSKENLEEARISIRVLDHGYFKESVIGCFDFDVSYVYFQKKHTLQHRWIALSNPGSSNYHEIQGYLKVSIAVTTKGDDPVQLLEDSSDLDKNDEAILMPAQLKPSYKQLRIKIFRAERLPMLDNSMMGLGKGESIDAYIECKYLNFKQKTSIIKGKRNEVVVWNQEFLLPVTMPIMSGRVILKVMDEDINLHETVGSIRLDINDYIEEDGGECKSSIFWKNIYGAHVGYSGSNSDQMNENPEIASSWKGRVLIQVCSEETDKPIFLRRQITDKNLLLQAEEASVPHNFDIIAEVCQGIALPEENTSYNVMIKIAEYQVKTQKPLVKEGTYNRWTCRFNSSPLLAPYNCVAKIGRIFVYLMKDDKPISYWKGDASDFEKENATIQWVEMINDPSVGAISDAYKAGLIGFKLSIKQRQGAQPFNFLDQPSWKAAPPSRPPVKTVRAYIFQCRDLPNADDDSQSDPYVVMWSQLTKGSDVKIKTNVIEDNNNPIFQEYLHVPVVETYGGETDLPPFVFDIYDKDNMSDDYIGRSVVYVDEAAIGNTIEIPDPTWHPVRMRPGGPTQGEILVSFTVVDQDFPFENKKKGINYQKPVSEKVKVQEYQIDINILGLRDLQSVGILPVKKAFVSFNLKSLVSPEQGEALENIKTQPGPTGPNPTINSSMSFKVALPTDQLYCPKLVVNIFDFIYKGKSQPIIGSFNIPVGQLIKDLKEENDRELDDLRKALEEIDQIIRDEVVPLYKQQTSHMFNSAETSNTKKGIIPKLGKFLGQKLNDNLILQPNEQEEDEESKKPLLQDYKGTEMVEVANKYSINGGQIHLQTEDFKRSEQVVYETQKTYEKARGINRVGLYEKKKTSAPNAFLIQKKDTFGLCHQNELLEEHLQELENNIQQQDERRQQDYQQFKIVAGAKALKNVLYPQFAYYERLRVYREINLPPTSLFINLGWDEFPTSQGQQDLEEFVSVRGNALIKKKDMITYNLVKDTTKSLDTRKHYRRYYGQELEKVKEIMPKESPFNSYDIVRGRSRGFQNPLWRLTKKMKQDHSGEISTETVVGKFKGLIQVQSVQDLEEYKESKKLLISLLMTKLIILQQKLKKNLLVQKNQEDQEKEMLEKIVTDEGRHKIEAMLEDLGISHLNVVQRIANLYSEEILKKLLLSQQRCVVRLHVMNAFNLSQRDFSSASDPYLLLSCGSTVYNERKNYQLDCVDPDFYKTFEFDGSFPGCAPLVIKLMDYDDMFGDELIGSTSIDLEDRYFSPEWQSIRQKPIEFRDLYHPSSTISQGTVKLWVEIIPVAAGLKDQVQFDFTPKPSEEFEVRLVVYETRDISMMDVEGTSDVYAKAFFDPSDAKETDTHYRCTNGKASFNYRLLFNLKHPIKDQNGYRLNLQLFDRDFFKSNDTIGEASIDLGPLMEDVALTKRPLTLNSAYYLHYFKDKTRTELEFKDESSFWLTINSGSQANAPATPAVKGQVRIEVTIIPKNLAEKNQVGVARKEPNHSPFLPPPVGRLNLSLNPFKMLSQLVGPAQLRKFYLYCILVMCCVLCLAMLPMILSNLLGSIIGKAISGGV